MMSVEQEPSDDSETKTFEVPVEFKRDTKVTVEAESSEAAIEMFSHPIDRDVQERLNEIPRREWNWSGYRLQGGMPVREAD
jgi:cell fate regulator YaaT (PSP1 superfamily)